MNHFTTILLFITILSACDSPEQNQAENSMPIQFEEIVTKSYELIKPSESIHGVLILFGGYPESAVDIKREFKIIDDAKAKNIAVLFMNFNRKIWLSQEDKVQLHDELTNCFKEHNLPLDNIYIGGFSSGGNVSLLLTSHLKSVNSLIQPKGVFIVDSPIDLLELYKNCLRNLEKNYSEISIQEATWLQEVFEQELGIPDVNLESYEAHSPFTSLTKNIDNLRILNGVDFRFYTEPDTLWWKENRNNSPNELNAHWIQKLSIQLKNELPLSEVEYIATSNRGYRANGVRHPHSWSIVDSKELINWIMRTEDSDN